MADLIELSSPTPAPTPGYRRIRRASRGLELLFAILFWAFSALAVAALAILFFYRGTFFAFGPHGGVLSTGPVPAGYLPVSAWRLDQKLAYLPVVLVRSAPVIGLFGCLSRLFRLYRQGVVFAPANARLIQWAGICLLADAVAPFGCHLALSATGYEIDGLWAHMISLQELVLGAVVFVIAAVMQVGHEIEEDREGFV
jgi:hypothetical protein